MYESKLGVTFSIAAQSNGDRHFSLKVPFQDSRLLQYQKVIYFFYLHICFSKYFQEHQLLHSPNLESLATNVVHLQS